MSRHVTILLGFFLSVLLLASIGGFLFYVPAVSWITCIVVLVGMILMFLLGLHTGARRIRLSRRMHPPDLHKAIEWVSVRRAG